jgi:hypothetical protein
VSRDESTARHFEHLTARDLQVRCDVVCYYEVLLLLSCVLLLSIKWCSEADIGFSIPATVE